jgi:hypothetical protein
VARQRLSICDNATRIFGRRCRREFETRLFDIAVRIRNPKYERLMKRDGNGIINVIAANPEPPVPTIDGSSVLQDGARAVVRGLDYHVDRIERFGRNRRRGRWPSVASALTTRSRRCSSTPA